MPSGVALLLKQLIDVLSNYKHLKDGAKHEFQQLIIELGLLKAFLDDSAKKSEKDEVFKKIESMVRELVYDAEDTIETCLTKMTATKNKNIFGQWIVKISISMERKVKQLRKRRVKPVFDLMKNFGEIPKAGTEMKKVQSTGEPSVTFIHNRSTGKQIVTTPQEQSIEQPASQEQSIEQPSAQEQSNMQDGFVDFEEEETIIGYLLESKDELDVISISGMPGLGKTTLASKIFQKEEISKKFPIRIWVRVSQTFKSRDVFHEILGKFTPNHTSSPVSEEELIQAVRKCLAKEKFLLVMDDVWRVQDWNEIEKILPNSEGKVLVTSRLENVAALATKFRKPLHLSKLGSKKRLELLNLKASVKDELFSGELKAIGQAIADKCDGVPQIIVVIGGVLKHESRNAGTTPSLIERWSDVLGNVNNILRQDKDNSISNLLELSYNILTDESRACFLYTGLFPGNLEIPVSTLTQLWIAEGFIQKDNGGDFEECAEKILDDLINMNLLSVGKKNLDRVKTCGIHDMVRRFCKAKAMEQNFFRVMKKSSKGVIKPSVSEVPNFRRLCLHSDLSKFLTENPKGKLVRSFLYFFDEPYDLNEKDTSTIPKAFNLLRVLSCKSITFQKFPNVAKPYLLRHISLSINDLRVLPHPIISKLINLQTLIVVTNPGSTAVKANIWKMIQLRRFKTKATIFLDEKKWKGEALENLQTVSRLSPESCKPELSKMAPNLNTLGIQGKLANLFRNFSLEEFRHLEKLKLVNDLGGERASNNPLLRLPQSADFPQHFKRLTLSKTYLEWDRHMPILAQINTLKVLKLKDNAFTGAFWVADEGSGFRGLQFLLIENSKLLSWKASITHFPSLTSLVLKKCKDLLKIPECLAENLVELEIEGVKRSVADSAREIESRIKQAEHAIWRAPFKLTVGLDCDS